MGRTKDPRLFFAHMDDCTPAELIRLSVHGPKVENMADATNTEAVEAALREHMKQLPDIPD